MHSSSRIWEIDLLRGVAVILMVVYHLVFDLTYFFQVSIDLGGFWYYVGRTAAILFIAVSGIASSLLYKKYALGTVSKTFGRAGKVMVLALLITLVSWITLPQETIFFGILHFLAVSMVLSLPFLRFKTFNILLGTILILAGFWFGNTLLPLPGITFTISFSTLDYYPLLPWFGVTLWGIALGNMLYSSLKSLWPAPKDPVTCSIRYAGKRSLWIYMVHQPLILLVLSLVFRKLPW